MSKEILSIENKNLLKAVKFKYPELMNEDSEALIISEYNKLLECKTELQDSRVKVRELENKVKELETSFQNKMNLFTLEFDYTTKEVTREKSSIMIKGHGNDTLGITSYV